MLSIFENLRKILVLERKKGYNNQAVTGGLQEYASNFQKQALQEATKEEEKRIIQEITQRLTTYPHIPFSERSDHIEQLFALIEGRKPLPSQNQERRTETDEFSRQKEELLLEIEKLCIQQRSLYTEIDTLKIRKETLLSQIENLSAQKEQFQADIKQFEYEHNGLQSQIDSLQHYQTELDSEINQLTSQKNEFIYLLNQLQAKIENLKSEEERLKKEQEVSLLFKEITDLINRKMKIEKEIDTLVQDLVNREHDLKIIHQEIKQRNKELAEIEARPVFTRGAGWKEKETQLKTELDELNEQKIQIDNEIFIFKQNLKDYREQRERLAQKITL